LRFDFVAAPDARAYLFHPTQTMIDEADGSVTGRFRAAGLLHMAQQLMTWGPTGIILAPDLLKVLMFWSCVSLPTVHPISYARSSSFIMA
jgi:hypothetical protein